MKGANALVASSSAFPTLSIESRTMTTKFAISWKERVGGEVEVEDADFISRKKDVCSSGLQLFLFHRTNKKATIHTYIQVLTYP